MKRIVLILLALATTAGVVGTMVHAHGQTDQQGPPVWITKMPAGYRDWKWISSAHEAGNLNSIGAVLGNDVILKAYRDKTLPFPDGSMIAALHYSYVPSEENNKIFGREQSFVPGPPTNIQFMIRDSKKYAATGGWGFGHFNKDGTVGNETLMKTCFPCHAQTKATDLVFTHYAP